MSVVQNENYGYVGYTHAMGIDAPVGMIRNREVVALHQTWRGQYARSTDETGAATTCAPGGSCGDPYPWPGMAPFSYGLNPEFAKTHIWYGSLAKDQYDQSGLQYRRNRYYDPMMGQFTQDDPIGVAGGLNTYGYANGDPVNFSDPFGLCPVPGHEEKTCIEDIDWLVVSVPPSCGETYAECAPGTRLAGWQQAGGALGLQVGGGGSVSRRRFHSVMSARCDADARQLSYVMGLHVLGLGFVGTTAGLIARPHAASALRAATGYGFGIPLEGLAWATEYGLGSPGPAARGTIASGFWEAGRVLPLSSLLIEGLEMAWSCGAALASAGG